MKKEEAVRPQCVKELLALRDTLEIISSKWSLPVLQYLFNRIEEKNNFRKIERGVEGISAKMLTKELKVMETNKLIERTIQDTKPVTVDYAITEYGKTVIPVIKVLVNWGRDHRMMLGISI